MGQTTSTKLVTSPIEQLKHWSGYNNYTIIFDSDIHGNGRETLWKIIFNKRNLYFIHFVDNKNVFGGYISTKIQRVDHFTKDSNAFLFSIYRKGKLINEKYPLKDGFDKFAFYLWSENNYSLYSFGDEDIRAHHIGNGVSYCYRWFYNYSKDKHPFVDTKEYILRRIIVVEMK